MTDDFDSKSEHFLNEFRAQPDAFLHRSLRIYDLRTQNRGRGVVATTNIPANTVLFAIPRCYVMSVESSSLCQQHPHLLKDFEVELDDPTIDDVEDLPKSWLNLILVLIYDYFHHEASRWRSYWNILPSEFNTMMFWSDGELSELQASSVRNHVGRESADKMFLEKVIPFVKQHMSIFNPSSSGLQLNDSDLLRICHRMGSLIMSYAFDLESQDLASDAESEGEDGWTEDRETLMSMGMVPLADTLNADAEFNAHLEHESDQLVMRSLHEIKAGEEVLNYYGPLPNCDLARRYGYTSQLHSRYDVTEISWHLILKVITSQLPGEFKPMNVTFPEFEESFILERESGDPDETGVNQSIAKFTAFPEELIDQATAFISAALGYDARSKSLTETQRRRLKTTFLQVMHEALETRLGEYATSAEEDESILNRVSISVRLKMAVDIRLGEKRLLKEAQRLVEDLMRKYGILASPRTNPLSAAMEEPSAKRLKRQH